MMCFFTMQHNTDKEHKSELTFIEISFSCAVFESSLDFNLFSGLVVIASICASIMYVHIHQIVIHYSTW